MNSDKNNQRKQAKTRLNKSFAGYAEPRSNQYNDNLNGANYNSNFNNRRPIQNKSENSHIQATNEIKKNNNPNMNYYSGGNSLNYTNAYNNPSNSNGNDIVNQKSFGGEGNQYFNNVNQDNNFN